MRIPSKRITFLFAFLAANFLLWFPFAGSLDEEGEEGPAEPPRTRIEGVDEEEGAGADDGTAGDEDLEGPER